MHGRLLVSVPEALHALGVGRSTFYKLIRAGSLQQVHIGRRSFVTRDSVMSFVDTLIEQTS